MVIVKSWPLEQGRVSLENYSMTSQAFVPLLLHVYLLLFNRQLGVLVLSEAFMRFGLFIYSSQSKSFYFYVSMRQSSLFCPLLICFGCFEVRKRFGVSKRE
ncbi:MAG: hypothetical protein ACJAQ4_000239 [Cryomorphaceae bacterium]|jgi:hypothetical protein